jgi:hypothetical protein
MTLAISGLSPNEWQAATRDERLDSLQELEIELSARQGRHVCSIETFPGPAGRFGNYNPSDPTHMHFNDRYLGPTGLFEAVSTVAHEGRHAYQHHCYSFPDKHPEVDKPTIDSWRENSKIQNYIRPTRENYEKYLEQPIEKDAYSYEATIINELNLHTLSRVSMNAQQTKTDVSHSDSQRQAPPPMEGGAVLMSPSTEALDEMRLAYYGDPVELSAKQFPKNGNQAPAQPRETIALPKNFAQALLDERNGGSAKGLAADEYTLLVKGESVPLMDGSIEMKFNESTDQYTVQCDKAQESALQKHLGELFSKQQPAERVQRQPASKDFERE